MGRRTTRARCFTCCLSQDSDYWARKHRQTRNCCSALVQSLHPARSGQGQTRLHSFFFTLTSQFVDLFFGFMPLLLSDIGTAGVGDCRRLLYQSPRQTQCGKAPVRSQQGSSSNKTQTRRTALRRFRTCSQLGPDIRTPMRFRWPRVQIGKAVAPAILRKERRVNLLLAVLIFSCWFNKVAFYRCSA